MLDRPIPILLSVMTSEPVIERMGATEIKNKVYKNVGPIGLIAISDKFIVRQNLTPEMFLAVLTHEYKHDSHKAFADASLAENE